MTNNFTSTLNEYRSNEKANLVILEYKELIKTLKQMGQDLEFYDENNALLLRSELLELYNLTFEMRHALEFIAGTYDFMEGRNIKDEG